MYYTALIGYPTDHSVSHVLYEQLLKASGIDVAYKHIKVDVRPKDLKASVEALKQLHFSGISVTLPHKMAVMKYLDVLDVEAKELGAVNTIKVGTKLHGYNTDWVGISTPVKLAATKPFREATIFGTGGAARAAIYACRQLGISTINVLYCLDHYDDKLQYLMTRAEELNICLYDYSKVASLVVSADLVINATSAGMVGKDPVPFELEVLDDINVSSKLFFDVVFNPLETPLLNYFKRQGAATIDGLWMMIYQGVRALSIWLDRDIQVERRDLEQIHKILQKELQHA